ncbi:hypothetical protein Tco_0810530 [Tanacetum coccineum]
MDLHLTPNGHNDPPPANSYCYARTSRKKHSVFNDEENKLPEMADTQAENHPQSRYDSSTKEGRPIAKLEVVFQKQFSTPQQQHPDFLQHKGSCYVKWSIEEDHVAGSVKSPKKDGLFSHFKDKAYRGSVKRNEIVWMSEAEHSLVDVECTAPYESTSGTDYTKLFQREAPGRTFRLDAETEIDDNTSRTSVISNTEANMCQLRSWANNAENGFYEKLNALKFVPQKELSGDQAYWLSANEIASQASKPATPPFVHKSRPPSQVLASLRNVNAVFPQFEVIDTSSASNAIFEINKLRQQLQGKDDTIRNLDAQINIMKVLNVGSTEGSCDQQALDTDRLQLKDTITSLRIQLDGLKVENVSLKRRYDELSKANTHSRTAYTEKLSAFTAENTKLKAQVTGTTSSGPSTSEKPKVLALREVIPTILFIPIHSPPKRAQLVKPTPLPKIKQATSGPPRLT